MQTDQLSNRMARFWIRLDSCHESHVCFSVVSNIVDMKVFY